MVGQYLWWGNLSQIAVIHTQSRIKDGPLAATSYKEDFMESFWKLPSHNPYSRYYRPAMGRRLAHVGVDPLINVRGS